MKAALPLNDSSMLRAALSEARKGLDEGGIPIGGHSEECVQLLRDYVSRHPEVWGEDIGEVGTST